MQLPQPVLALCDAIRSAGGEAWLVGGCVRDHLLGRPPKDLDIEVHKLPAGALKSVLKRHGRVKAVGRSFGVFKLRMGDLELDIGLPQTASSRVQGTDEITVQGDPWISLPESARRRDLTINAIAYDPLTEAYADPYCGREDLAAGMLREVSPQTFVEDPLRVLRVMQFAARFEFAVAPSLAQLCLDTPISDLQSERVWIELQKLLLKPSRPSLGLDCAGRLAIFERVLPSLVPVNDARLGAALDAAAAMRADAEHPLALMLAVLLHRVPDDAESILDRLKVFTLSGYPLRARVLHAVSAWPTLTTPASPATLRWLAEDGEVALVARTALAATGADAAASALQQAAQMGITIKPTPALIKGRDLRPLGIPPGPHMGKILKAVRVAQLDGDVCDPEGAIALVQRLWSSQTF